MQGYAEMLALDAGDNVSASVGAIQGPAALEAWPRLTSSVPFSLVITRKINFYAVYR